MSQLNKLFEYTQSFISPSYDPIMTKYIRKGRKNASHPFFHLFFVFTVLLSVILGELCFAIGSLLCSCFYIFPE